MEFIVLYLHKSYFVFNSPECLRKKTFWSPSIGGPQSRSYDAGIIKKNQVSVILKNVSWNISYLEVRMAFHPFPQLIGEFCNIQPFDPL